MNIGVLALQGSFAEHIRILNNLGVKTSDVRLQSHLEGLDGLIIPGGESTTIGKLAVHNDLIEPLQVFGRQKPIWGTCAGAIFLSKDTSRQQPLLQLMDIKIERNAFGRQVASFELDLQVPALEKVNGEVVPFHAVFIRAPLISATFNGVKELARLPDGRIVAAQQGRLLATSFHPELTGDDRFHRYFLSLASKDE
jgi:pyridoxal 5'-phosphate synthase pdxT subunit